MWDNKLIRNNEFRISDNDHTMGMGSHFLRKWLLFRLHSITVIAQHQLDVKNVEIDRMRQLATEYVYIGIHNAKYQLYQYMK